ncbi:MAG: hypothetical protein ACREDO_10905 [Methyloceanibacter sp.]
MRLATKTCLTVALLLGLGGLAQAADEAGKPLDTEACKAAWSMASPNGETISEDKAVKYVINFTMVDSDKDGQISADEFNKGCEAGMVKADEATVKDM